MGPLGASFLFGNSCPVLLRLGRWPILSALVLVGAGVVASARDAPARRLPASPRSGWRSTAGARPGGIFSASSCRRSPSAPRLVSPFVLGAPPPAAYGVNEPALALAAPRPASRFADRRGRRGGRARRLSRPRRQWGEHNLAAFERERADLEATLADVAIVAECPGCAAPESPPPGARFFASAVPVYAFLTGALRSGQPSPSYLRSARSDGPARRIGPARRGPGVRAVVAPVGQDMPPLARATHGRFVVYDGERGLLGPVDVVARYGGHAPVVRAESGLAARRRPMVASGRARRRRAASLSRWDPLPAPAADLPPMGRSFPR
jgi:hypothetical protein